jgi:CRP-like cAMP-binding protein
MFETFEAYIKTKVRFTPEELQLIRSMAIEKKLRKKQFLLQEGDVCRYKTFVSNGLLKTYLLKDDGTEYIMRFASENSWCIDHESYNNQTPSKYNIDALEASELVMWTKENFDQLLETIPAFKILSDKIKEVSHDANLERILMNISSTSEEKYQHFITSYPDVFRRVPLHMVASYLGVSRETLSRIRHAWLKTHKDI